MKIWNNLNNRNGNGKWKAKLFSDYVAKNFWDGFRQLNTEISTEKNKFAILLGTQGKKHCCLRRAMLNVSNTFLYLLRKCGNYSAGNGFNFVISNFQLSRQDEKQIKIISNNEYAIKSKKGRITKNPILKCTNL